MASSQTSTGFDADIAISGGGLAGLVCALAAAHAGLKVIVFDDKPKAESLDAAFDGRASAIAYANFRMLDVLGAGKALRAHACPIRSIMVTDGRYAGPAQASASPGSAFLRFDAGELEGRQGDEPLGWMVENQRMRAALMDALAGMANAQHEAPAHVTSVAADDRGAHVALANGRTVRARVLVGADGDGSLVRQAAGLRRYGWDYDQAGVVATVAMAKSHDHIAHEYFLPSGPFAILPLNDDRASLVWTERKTAAHAAMAASNAAFAQHIRRRFGDFLGGVELTGPRWSYPLGLRVSERFIAQRIALVGDAARRIHPIAGQGFNLALKDAAALAEVLADQARAGLDIAASDALARYQSWRRFDSVAMALATDALNRLFSNDFGPLRAIRNAGMALVNGIGPARRAFARDAGADLGDVPKLLRGQPLSR